jgi:hypothetical protein
MALPTSKTTFTTKTNGDVLEASHVNDIQTAVTGVENTVGITGSTDPNSLKYKVENTSSVNPGHKHTLAGALTDVVITSPTNGQALAYNTATSKWENTSVAVPDASTTVKGVTKLSVAPAVANDPIAVGDNDTRLGDTSYANKGIVRLNTDANTSGLTVASGVVSVNTGTSANQIVKLDGTGKLPAVDGSNLTNVGKWNFVSSVTVATSSPVSSPQAVTVPATANFAVVVGGGTNTLGTNNNGGTFTIARTGQTTFSLWVANTQWFQGSWSVSSLTLTSSPVGFIMAPPTV